MIFCVDLCGVAWSLVTFACLLGCLLVRLRPCEFMTMTMFCGEVHSVVMVSLDWWLSCRYDVF